MVAGAGSRRVVWHVWGLARQHCTAPGQEFRWCRRAAGRILWSRLRINRPVRRRIDADRSRRGRTVTVGDPPATGPHRCRRERRRRSSCLWRIGTLLRLFTRVPGLAGGAARYSGTRGRPGQLRGRCIGTGLRRFNASGPSYRPELSYPNRRADRLRFRDSPRRGNRTR